MPPETSPLPTGTKVLTVSEFTAQVRQLLGDAFPHVWISGEVSNLTQASSGHIYLVLKDREAQVQAAVWRSVASRLRFQLQHGMDVVARGRIDVWPPRGNYQLIVEEILPKGMGALELAFQQLKDKLAAKGYFDDARKKPLPRFPRRIGIVTSPTGAVIHDMLKIIVHRWPAVEVWLCAVRVQGEGAAKEIAGAIRLFDQLQCVDVLIVGRGGGSLEDLWAFNEEAVAEAIHRCRLPVISAVGHQTDFTIADFVADKRAATPSEAAQIVVPDCAEVLESLEATGKRLRQSLMNRLKDARQQLDALAMRRVFQQPLDRIRDLERQLDDWHDRAARAARRCLERAEQRLQGEAARLEGLSPLNVLARGYSLTRKETGLALLRSAAEVEIGDRLVTRLGHGQLLSRVEEVQPGESGHG